MRYVPKLLCFVLWSPFFTITFLFVGYGRQFNGLKDYLLKQSFANQIDVIGSKDAQVTGNFEVTANGQLIHSKRAGKGKAESSKERAMIAEQIVDILEEME